MENMYPPMLPVSPNRCALALALPLTREQFLADLSRPDQKDFVHHFRAEKGLQKADPEFCWEVYQAEEASFAEAVCYQAERLGVTVRYEARLSDLTDLLGRFSVVSLVSHWRFVPVEPEDILEAPKMLELLKRPENQPQESIKQACETLDAALFQSETNARWSREELQRRLAGVISTIANEAERLYWDDRASRSFKPELTLDGLGSRLTRLEFERAFPGIIAPARMIEFHDGMHTVAELVESVPNDFAGLLDLTVCNSVIPAAWIRHSRPSCLVAANRRPAELRSRMYLYGLQISLLAKRPMPFVDVIKQVHVGKHSYNTKGGKLWSLFGKFFNIIPGRR
jgi:hypothetical protein